MAETRQQIQAEINKHLKFISQCEKTKTGYNNAINYAKKMLSSLNSSLENLTSANDELKRSFTIDGKTADAGRIDNLRNELHTAIKEVNNTIIPELNACIKEITNTIRYRNNLVNDLRRKLAEITE